MGPVHTVWIICSCGWPVEVGAFCELPSISRYASGNRFRSRLRAVPPPRPGRSVRSSKPVSRSVMYCENPVFEYSPSLGTSIPHSACMRTASDTCRSISARALGLNGVPSALRCRTSTTSGGRTRLPTCVVRMRRSLRFIGLHLLDTLSLAVGHVADHADADAEGVAGQVGERQILDVDGLERAPLG